MTQMLPGRAIARSLAVIALLVAGAGAMVREATAQLGPGGVPAPDQGPTCDLTRPDLVITSARLGHDSDGRPAYLDVVVMNANFGCSQTAGTFTVYHSTNGEPSIDQHIQIC